MRIKKSIAVKILLVFIIALSAFWSSLSVQKGHDSGGDFALYIEQAQALLSGSINELYAVNKITTDSSDILIGPYLYPNGFPLLLTPIYFVKGIHFRLMKFLCVLFFIGTLPLMYHVLKRGSKSLFIPLFTLASIALHGSYITFSDKILSDFPFLFFCFLSFYLMYKSKKPGMLVLLGVVMFYAYFTRDVGIFLVPSLMVYQWQKSRQHGSEKIIYYFLPYLVFAFLFVANLLFLPIGGQNHYHVIMTGSDPSFFWSYYADIISSFMFGNSLSTILWIPVLSFIVLGVYSTWARTAHLSVFALLCFTITVMWPSMQGIRLLFPILPLVMFYFFEGIVWTFGKPKEMYTNLVLSFYVLGLSYIGISNSYSVLKTDSNTVYSKEMQGVYSFIRQHTNSNDIIVYDNPRAMRLFTGRNSYFVFFENFKKVHASYLLLKKNTGISESDVSVCYESENYILFKK